MDFYERLRNICSEKNTTVTKVLHEIGLSSANTGYWKKGQLPKGDALLKISEYLNVSIDLLLTGEYTTDLNDDESKLISFYRSVPDKAKYKVLCDFEEICRIEIDKLTR
ncbi:MAG: helix-turn-helix domain-containing protein [Oscillospiraceae bacterium]|nr:helix-turn-helix domain-containing protein [Oscillospiraceae bacterium]